MANNHLEQLVAEWYEYSGYFVRRNVRVGKLARGGYECELDVVAYNPTDRHLVHFEPSTDASSWAEREVRFRKKFEAGTKYIPDIFPSVDFAQTQFEQYALFVFASKQSYESIGGGKIMLLPELVGKIVDRFSSFQMVSAMVPEQYPILRTLQVVAEYRGQIFSDLV